MWYFLGVVVLLMAVLAVRALLFVPRDGQTVLQETVTVDEKRAVEDFQAMIRCRTISYEDASLHDEKEFEKFRELLDERFPLVAQQCEKTRVAPAGVIYRWKGKNNTNPWVLMSHYDVVPVEESMWSVNPFEALLKDGSVWGRGTVDTKSTLLGVMEAAQTLMEQGFTPQNDIYMAFGGDEELDGESAQAMVKWFEAQNIHPTVIDEGGAIIEGIFPGVSKPAAVIGTGEKGITNIGFSIEGKGGHASTPPPHTPVGVMAKAIVAVENKPFKPKMVPPVREMFDTLGRHASFGMKLIFANLWCFQPVLYALAKKKGGELNAMIRTTCAFTRMEGGPAWNVIPPRVSAGANLRLLNQTPEQAVRELKQKIGDERVKVTLVMGNTPSPFSRTDSEGWAAVKEAILQTWPDVIVSPYLMMAASDSRHYARISDRVYRFSPMEMPAEIRSTIHGHNEHIPVETLLKTVAFYMRLIRKI